MIGTSPSAGRPCQRHWRLPALWEGATSGGRGIELGYLFASRYLPLLPAERKVSGPSEDVCGFAETILEFARKNGIDLIIPITDWTVMPLSKCCHQFEGVSRLALGPIRRSSSLPTSSGPSLGE
jgi:hypothetical protein